jgi:hypothetical protein
MTGDGLAFRGSVAYGASYDFILDSHGSCF